MKRKETKTGSVKAIPLPPNVLAALADHRAWQVEQARKAGTVAVSGPILANWRAAHDASRPYSAAWLSLAFSRLCDACGVPDFKFHGLRHMHGSLLLERGVSPATAAERQGHGLQVFLGTYAHSVSGAAVAAAVEIGDALDGMFALNERNQQ